MQDIIQIVQKVSPINLVWTWQRVLAAYEWYWEWY